MAIPTVAEVKANLIIEGSADDTLISSFISAAVSYAEAFQHLDDDYYTTTPEGGTEPPKMTARTKQAVIMLASHYYESRDGGTGGFFADNTQASQQTMFAVDNLLRLDRDWKV